LKSVSDIPPFFLYTAQVARARPTKVGELTIPRLSSHSPAVASHLAIDHVPLAQAALLKKFGKSDDYDFFAEIDFRPGPILQIIAQLLVRSWDNGWDSRNGSRCARITFKVRRGNDLVDFESRRAFLYREPPGSCPKAFAP